MARPDEEVLDDEMDDMAATEEGMEFEQEPAEAEMPEDTTEIDALAGEGDQPTEDLTAIDAEGETEGEEPEGLPDDPPVSDVDKEIDSVINTLMEGDEDGAKVAFKKLVTVLIQQAVDTAVNMSVLTVENRGVLKEFNAAFTELTEGKTEEEQQKIWSYADAQVTNYQSQGDDYATAVTKAKEDMMSQYSGEGAPETPPEPAAEEPTTGTRKVNKPDEAIDTAQSATPPATPAGPSNDPREVVQEMRRQRGLA